MDSSDLQHLATRARSMREIGIGLLIASGLLGLFLFIPIASQKQASLPEEPETTLVNAFADIPLEAKSAIVYDVTTGKALYERNADAQLPLASLTKLLTVYAALATLSPTTPVTISSTAARVEAPRIFSVGQTFSLADLARLTLTASLNDGAVAMAETTAARENRSQADMLAGVAAGLTLSQTYALNGSGLDTNTAISGGYGSARDMAKLSGALVELAPDIASATTLNFAQATSAGGTSFTVKNTDPIVDTIPGLLLSKTGYTELASGNLALVFDVGIGHPIAIVVLGSSQKARFTDGAALIAATLAHFAGVSSL